MTQRTIAVGGEWLLRVPSDREVRALARRLRILDALRQVEGSSTTLSALARQAGASPATVRKDLEELGWIF